MRALPSARAAKALVNTGLPELPACGPAQEGSCERQPGPSFLIDPTGHRRHGGIAVLRRTANGLCLFKQFREARMRREHLRFPSRQGGCPR